MKLLPANTRHGKPISKAIIVDIKYAICIDKILSTMKLRILWHVAMDESVTLVTFISVEIPPVTEPQFKAQVCGVKRL